MNELTVTQSKPVAVNYTQEQIEVIRNTVAQGATDTELALFINQCKRTGLDAMTRQIYFIKNNGKVQIQTSVDGFRLIAERSGAYEGQTPAQWCGTDGKWVDVWLSTTPPSASRVGVFKKGFREPLYAVALWNEYCAQPSYMQKKMPALMLSKIAECLALRKAFPNDLSGIYASEEMEQSQSSSTPKVLKNSVVITTQKNSPQSEDYENPPKSSGWEDFAEESPAPAPAPQSEHPGLASMYDPNYRVSFGKYKGKSLQDMTTDEIVNYSLYLQNQASNANKPLGGGALDFVQQADAYIAYTRGKN